MKKRGCVTTPPCFCHERLPCWRGHGVVNCTDIKDEYLRKYSGKFVEVKSSAARILSRAYNISALKKPKKTHNDYT